MGPFIFVIWLVFYPDSDLVPRGLVESPVLIVCSSLFMFRWEHARSLSHSLILLPDSRLVSVGRARSHRCRWLGVLVQDGQLVQARLLVIWKYFWLWQLGWRCYWLAFTMQEQLPQQTIWPQIFTEADNSWTEMEIRKWPISEVSLTFGQAFQK